MRKVIISPYSKLMRNGKRNPKNYPFWEDVVKGLQRKKLHVIQIGIEGEEKLGANEVAFGKTLDELSELARICTTWASVDNFFHHLCYLLGKPGIVIFGRSDPQIFGHPIHDNLLKDRCYLRAAQFNFWEEVEYSTECFVEPQVVIDTILRRVSNGN